MRKSVLEPSEELLLQIEKKNAKENSRYVIDRIKIRIKSENNEKIRLLENVEIIR